jgi:hypothetical protein
MSVWFGAISCAARSRHRLHAQDPSPPVFERNVFAGCHLEPWAHYSPPARPLTRHPVRLLRAVDASLRRGADGIFSDIDYRRHFLHSACRNLLGLNEFYWLQLRGPLLPVRRLGDSRRAPGPRAYGDTGRSVAQVAALFVFVTPHGFVISREPTRRTSIKRSCHRDRAVRRPFAARCVPAVVLKSPTACPSASLSAVRGPSQALSPSFRPSTAST